MKEEAAIIDKESLVIDYRESFDLFLNDVKKKVGIDANTQ